MMVTSTKRVIWFLAFAFVFWSLSQVVMAGTKVDGKKPSKYAPGELLVKYSGSFRSAGSEDRGNQWRGAIIRKFKQVGIDRVRVRDGMTVEEALEDCRKDPDVEYAEPNYVRRMSQTIPNDPHFADLWGLDNTGQKVDGVAGTADADMDAPEAWDIQTGHHKVIVAVFDTGADLDHEDLTANIWRNLEEDWDTGNPGNDGLDNDQNGRVDDYYGWDFANDDGRPDDDNGHGTHVCGTIGAEGDNGKGVVGVNWSVSIMPLKILDAKGDGLVSDEIAAIEYAVSHGAKIINASYSGSSFSNAEYDAIKDARDAGILFVAAAGNEGSDNGDVPAYPAGYDRDNIIAVAAIDNRDALASFSNYGATTVDVAAPGAEIYSTKVGDSYQALSGTSMAAPYLSGLAALIWAEDWEQDGDFDYGYQKVKERILNGVDVLSGLGGKILMAGRINAYNSLVPVELSQKPETPSLGSADGVASYAVCLTWVDNAFNESGFKVFRALASAGPYGHVGTAAANVGSFTDTTARDGTTYYYAVAAFNTHGDSNLSDQLAAKTPLAAPTGLTAQAISSTRIDLSWRDNSTVELGYGIEEQVGSGGGFESIATVDPNVQTYSRTGLDPSTTYTYRVRAYKGSEFSDYSNTASALPSVASSAGSVSAGGSGGGGGGCFVSTVEGEGFLGLSFVLNPPIHWPRRGCPEPG
jgi:subtilisin family serine protease